MIQTGHPCPRATAVAGSTIPKLPFFTLAASELPTRSPSPKPLDAPANAAGIVCCWNIQLLFKPSPFIDTGTSRAPLPWPALRLLLRPGARTSHRSLRTSCPARPTASMPPGLSKRRRPCTPWLRQRVSFLPIANIELTPTAIQSVGTFKTCSDAWGPDLLRSRPTRVGRVKNESVITTFRLMTLSGYWDSVFHACSFITWVAP